MISHLLTMTANGDEDLWIHKFPLSVYDRRKRKWLAISFNKIEPTKFPVLILKEHELIPGQPGHNTRKKISTLQLLVIELEQFSQ